MHASEWIALVTPAITILSAGIVGVFRIVRSIDRVGDKLAVVIDRQDRTDKKVDDHEHRLRDGGL